MSKKKRKDPAQRKRRTGADPCAVSDACFAAIGDGPTPNDLESWPDDDRKQLFEWASGGANADSEPPALKEWRRLRDEYKSGIGASRANLLSATFERPVQVRGEMVFVTIASEFESFGIGDINRAMYRAHGLGGCDIGLSVALDRGTSPEDIESAKLDLVFEIKEETWKAIQEAIDEGDGDESGTDDRGPQVGSGSHGRSKQASAGASDDEHREQPDAERGFETEGDKAAEKDEGADEA